MAKEKREMTCKQCGKVYDQNEVKRIYGDFSAPYNLGFCSSRCYTLNTLNF